MAESGRPREHLLLTHDGKVIYEDVRQGEAMFTGTNPDSDVHK
jgi:hypothetical protein